VSPIVRVDDRLVHGQVVVGWGHAVGLRHLVLVDDAIRASPWEQDLYRMGVPRGVDIEFASVTEAATAFPQWRGDGERTMLILPDVATLVRLCALAEVGAVQLGGIHQAEGRRERLPYVFLSDQEAEALRALDARGVSVTAQDLPSTRPVALADLVS